MRNAVFLLRAMPLNASNPRAATPSSPQMSAIVRFPFEGGWFRSACSSAENVKLQGLRTRVLYFKYTIALSSITKKGASYRTCAAPAALSSE